MTSPTHAHAAPTPRPSAVDPHSHADRAASFEHGANVYAQVRPSYPRKAVEWALPVGTHRVLDLAAGTGRLTEVALAVLDDASRRTAGRPSHAAPDDAVVAVDPSATMLAELSSRLPVVDARLGTAERIPLPDGSVDAVLVGQAWHWFDVAATTVEIARVLRPGGVLAILWNDRDDDVDWVAEFGAILHRGDRLEPVAGNTPAPELGPAFTQVEARTVHWTDRIPTASLRTLAGTRSYLLTLPPAEREALLDDVDTLAATHPRLAGRGEVDLPYVTRAYRATRH